MNSTCLDLAWNRGTFTHTHNKQRKKLKQYSSFIELSFDCQSSSSMLLLSLPNYCGEVTPTANEIRYTRSDKVPSHFPTQKLVLGKYSAIVDTIPITRRRATTTTYRLFPYQDNIYATHSKNQYINATPAAHKFNWSDTCDKQHGKTDV